MKKMIFSLLAAAGAMAVSAATPATNAGWFTNGVFTPQPSDPQAKYIFYCIGDGMGMSPVMAAQAYAKNVLYRQGNLTMLSWPVASMATTFSASSDVTDSAAAGTALSTGHKTNNGMLGMTPDSVAVTSIAKTLHEAGYGVALLTSVGIDDATPAAFYAHVPKRSHFRQIGSDMASSGFEFFAGAGLRGARDKEGNDTGLMDELAQSGLSISYSLDSIDLTASRLLLLSPNREELNEVGYTIDSIPGAFTLQGMFEAAMGQMQRVSPQKFFMMMEAGNIDHANHGNDGGTSMIETINFDNTLRMVYDFYRAHPAETLIVVTADHNTGGMSVANDQTGYSINYGALAGQRVSKEAFNNYCRGILKSRLAYTWADMEQYLRENLGLGTTFNPSADELQKLRDEFEQVFTNRNAATDRQTLYTAFNAFADNVFDLLNRTAGVGWTTGAHTGDFVPVFAVGVGAERFSSLHDNTQLPGEILKIALGEN